MEGAAHALAGLGRHEEAAVAVGVADVLRREFSLEHMEAMFSDDVRAFLEGARAALGPEGLERGRSRAATMGVERGLAWAQAVALGEDPGVLGPMPLTDIA